MVPWFLWLVLAGCGGDLKVRIDETPPEARLAVRPACGPVPLEVSFDASESREDRSSIVGYAWDFDGDGFDDSLTVEPAAAHTYTDVGTLFARVRVTNEDSLSAAAVEEIWALSPEADPTICLYRNRRTHRVRGVEYTLGLSQYAYTRGDTLRFFYQIRNERPRALEFALHWTCQVDFYVFAGACTTLTAPECTKRWRFTDWETCTPRLTRIVLAPDETEHATASWIPQFVLSRGCHTAFGMLYTGPPSPGDSTIVWVSFEVE